MFALRHVWIVVSFLPFCWSLECLRCNNAHRATDCTKVATCQAGETCFTEEDPGGNGFNLGCRDEQTCRNATSPTCTQCCKTDVCNNNLCGITGFSTTAGPICYSCSSLLEIEECRTISQCQKGEACFSESSANNALGMTLHSHGCKSNQACTSSATTQGSDCSSCCRNDLCNDNCTQTGTKYECTTGIPSISVGSIRYPGRAAIAKYTRHSNLYQELSFLTLSFVCTCKERQLRVEIGVAGL